MERFGRIPEDVVVEILSWLPAESLMRFKCVRKSWYALFKNPEFVAKQESNQIQCIKTSNKPTILLMESLFSDSQFHLILQSYSNTRLAASKAKSDKVSVAVKRMKIANDDENVPFLDVAGYCNGLIFLYSHWSSDIILVNPAIREFRHLPVSCIPTPPQAFEDVPDFVEVCRLPEVGFGYDLKADDYKVVMIWSFYDAYKHSSWEAHPRPSPVEVYTLSSDSWTQINDYHPHKKNLLFLFQRCFNGVLYWLDGLKTEPDALEPRPAIAAFDLSQQVFQWMPMPVSFKFWNDTSRSLVVLNESLALFDCRGGDQRVFDLWVMEDEFGVNGTWCKILSIGPLEGIAKPLVFWGTDELLLGNDNKEVVSYDLTTKQIKNHLHTHYTSKFVFADIYLSNLLSLKRAN
ncbi:FBA_3 domain-containing protein [Cephalotus follicularis]|uniref:FBA_3 domain-containing protein n=1 Tax=Cephalotus follicularis TaxID=3775 RepID=A0A1Q3CYR9_CEPFO|nr:FBA_3 domain-containing protein [Cephalotus follicularis]